MCTPLLYGTGGKSCNASCSGSPIAICQFVLLLVMLPCRWINLSFYVRICKCVCKWVASMKTRRRIKSRQRMFWIKLRAFWAKQRVIKTHKHLLGNDYQCLLNDYWKHSISRSQISLQLLNFDYNNK